jgi:DNA mismatch repair ATPase MutS
MPVVVLVRLGDFYHAYDEDARVVARVHPCDDYADVKRLSFHYDALENVLRKLVRAGYGVSISEPV